MHGKWIATAEALPGENEYVYFLLDHHEVPIAGIYTLGGFRTASADYDGAHVKGWCPVMIENEPTLGPADVGSRSAQVSRAD